MKTEQLVSCTCEAHKITLTVDYDESLEIEKYWNPLIYLSVWKLYGENVPGWKEKLRHIWHIIKNGNPWDDQVILDFDQLIKLKNGIDVAIKFLEKHHDILEEIELLPDSMKEKTE